MEDHNEDGIVEEGLGEIAINPGTRVNVLGARLRALSRRAAGLSPPFCRISDN
jgi:hypothetical protein